MTTSVAANPIAIAPGGLPLVGHLPQFMRDRLGFLTRCAETDAAVALLRLDTDAYLLLDADDIKHVLESNHPNYDKTPRLTSARGRELSKRIWKSAKCSSRSSLQAASCRWPTSSSPNQRGSLTRGATVRSSMRPTRS
jgi:hypothetical protein